MKKLVTPFLFISPFVFGQMALTEAQEIAYKYEVGSYSYMEAFKGHAGYGAPLILTADGGAAFFGDFSDEQGSMGLLVKVDKKGREEWKLQVRPEFDELESQAVVQDKNGNYFVFMLSYNSAKYRGGCERVVYVDKTGIILWDKTFGSYELINSPTFSYSRILEDGRLYLRGHIVTEKPAEGKDPSYLFWEGWISTTGELTQKTGVVIDWANSNWQDWYNVE
ncbi:MAG: hypothetical protein HYZ14_10455 [Bacteroidetes bacterium]|nr:hypothetical protein [Bacteroidota bacterium]